MMTGGMFSPPLSPAISGKKRALIRELLDSRKASSLMIQTVSDAQMSGYAWRFSGEIYLTEQD